MVWGSNNKHASWERDVSTVWRVPTFRENGFTPSPEIDFQKRQIS